MAPPRTRDAARQSAEHGSSPDGSEEAFVDSLSSTFRESVQEGAHRLHRTWPSLLATGLVGGIDVSIGVLALLLVKTGGGGDLAAALAFGIGFVALTLANSELFTENFLLPITAVAAGKARWPAVGRLWAGTATMNLVGGLIMAVIMMVAFPELSGSATEVARHFVDRGIGVSPFLGAVVAGIIITLMTWMQNGQSSSVGGQLAAAVAAGFLLAYGELGHVVVASIEIFAAMAAGAPFGIAEWLPLFGQMAVGNAVGGIGLVTILRLVQVGQGRVEAEQRRPAPETAQDGGADD